MGHKYNKFYQQPKKSENSENKMEEVFDEVIDEIVVDSAAVLTNEEIDQLTEEDVIDVKVDEVVIATEGIVVNCEKLNVRKEAKIDSEVQCVIKKGDTVSIYPDESTEDFYMVCIASSLTKGFCMKQYIKLK